jgi:TatD-related deoxyribonuclease
VPLPADLPVVDHHCHLSPSGEGVAAALRFRRAGGTHLFVTTQTYGSAPPRRVDEYRDQFAMTERLTGLVLEESGVVAYAVVAPFPVDLVHVAPALGLEAAVELQFGALDLAAREVEEHRAIALGEVGRPHFPVPPEVAEASTRVFVRALELGRDVGCPVVVHSEDLGVEGYRSIAGLAARVGFPLHRLVKHYARTIETPEARVGIAPSYLARRDLVPRTLE